MNSQILSINNIFISEIWKDIKGYKGLYQISTYGNARRLTKIIWNGIYNRKYKGRLLKGVIDSTGYFNVVLSKKGITKKYRIHRLVAEAFILNLEKKPEVNHKDGNKQNNFVDNLEWMTKKENIKHAKENNLMQKGERNGRAKLKNIDVIFIKKNIKKFTIIKLAKMFNVAGTTISKIKNNKTWSNVC